MATLTAQEVIDAQKLTTDDITLINMEKLMDDAIDFINLEIATSIAAMTGNAGSKIATVTRSERVILKNLGRLYAIAYITGGSSSGRNITIGTFRADVADDATIKRLEMWVERGLKSLTTRFLQA